MNEVPYVVVDASVALKWAFNDEEHVAQAVALRDDWVYKGKHRLVAPSLFYYEVINGLRTAVLRGRIAMGTGVELLKHLLAVGVRLVDPEAEHIYQLACGFRIAAYDAAYLALAEVLDCLLWTGDRRFYEAVHGKAPQVRWIGDYPLV
jgi:predicted nucleic acid-binding protein